MGLASLALAVEPRQLRAPELLASRGPPSLQFCQRK